MFGILLAAGSALFDEVATSLGKREVRYRAESYYTFGFLNLAAGTILIFITGIVRDDLYFSAASLPTLLTRIALEILQAHVSILAIVKAERGDFGLIRVLTLPLLLLVDLALGYSISSFQIAGIALIFMSVVLLTMKEKFQTKGLSLILFSAVNAVATISLYKYNISHFNSVEGEQSIIGVVLVAQFYILARLKGEYPLRRLRTPLIAYQSIAGALASIFGAFAIVFAPASVITSALRASSVLLAIVSGKLYFHEKKFSLKMLLALGIICGICLLTLH